MRRTWSNDIRSTNRYALVREGSGPGGTGEVGTLRTITRMGERYYIVEFISADGYYYVWGTGEGKHTKHVAFASQQSAADHAIEVTLSTTHYERTKIS
jgi:hypothetical protein